MNRKSLTLQGTLGLSVAMGIGRFFYTPLLPIMMVALHWSGAVSSWIAAANYCGYLLGSLALSRNWVSAGNVLYRSSLVISTLLLAAMAITDNPVLHGIFRLLAGAASAIIFVSITQFAAKNVKSSSLVGIIYGGVGFGITVSGLVAWLLGQKLDWSQLWVAAAVISLIFSVIAWGWPVGMKTATHLADNPQKESGNFPRSNPPQKSDLQGSEPQDHTHNFHRAFRLLDIGYFFQGFGYIIIGTYLVVLSGPVFGSSAATITWVLAGIAAIPSPYLWSWLAERLGRRRALLSCYLLQVVGAIAAIFGDSTLLLILAAILFGATFMGVTMLTISTGVAYGVPGGSARLTTWYSLGQVVGPVIIGLLLSGSITASFVVATIAIVIGLATVQLSGL